jgi:hypothetical protein
LEKKLAALARRLPPPDLPPAIEDLSDLELERLIAGCQALLRGEAIAPDIEAAIQRHGCAACRMGWIGCR